MFPAQRPGREPGENSAALPLTSQGTAASAGKEGSQAPEGQGRGQQWERGDGGAGLRSVSYPRPLCCG